MNFAKYRVQLSTEKKYSSKYEYKYEYEYSIPAKEQIFCYKRAEKHKAKELMILSFKRALFPGNDQTGNGQVMTPTTSTVSPQSPNICCLRPKSEQLRETNVVAPEMS